MLITLATPRQDWTGSNPSRREGGGCGFTLSRSHSCCVVRLLYTQISPGHIWTTLYYIKNIFQFDIFSEYRTESRSRWLRRLRRGSAVARLLGLLVRIPPGTWMSVSCECCVLSGRVLCVGLITCTEESYRLWCVWVWSWGLDKEEAVAHCGVVEPQK